MEAALGMGSGLGVLGLTKVGTMVVVIVGDSKSISRSVSGSSFMGSSEERGGFNRLRLGAGKVCA